MDAKTEKRNGNIKQTNKETKYRTEWQWKWIETSYAKHKILSLALVRRILCSIYSCETCINLLLQEKNRTNLKQKRQN